jgi:hypothetical protein
MIDRSLLNAKRLLVALALGVLSACGGSPSGPTGESRAATVSGASCFQSSDDCLDQACLDAWVGCDAGHQVCCDANDNCACEEDKSGGGSSCGKMCSGMEVPNPGPGGGP